MTETQPTIFVQAANADSTSENVDTGNTASAPSTPGSASKQPASKSFTIDNFDIGRLLGKGKFGSVYLVKEKMSGQGKLLAMKVLFKHQLERHGVEHQLKHEVHIHTRMKHKHIIKLYSCFSDEKRVYLLLKYASGGELYKKLQDEGTFSNAQSALFLAQLISALRLCHRYNVIHRDIKPENLLLDGDGNVCLIDFGWSVVEATEARTTLCGTLDYIAPEMITGEEYNESVDIWALGVMMYEFLTGHPPFETEEADDTYTNIQSVTYDQDAVELDDQAKDLISKFLQRVPKDRISLKDAHDHPWMKANVDPDILKDLIERSGTKNGK